ncbi:MAG: hypothetical protein M3188_06985 [Actinomycetota bacterium]|nr:hypothetical protein [Actinomycetota bacterium]
MRQRWFGATGRKVPQIALEGDDAVPLAEALVLDDVADDRRLREAHEAGTPVVVRASEPEAVKRALERPEVACVVVPRERADLLELDLRRMTYGGASAAHDARLPGVDDQARQGRREP